MVHSEVFTDTFDDDFGVSLDNTETLLKCGNECLGDGNDEVNSPFPGGGSPIFNMGAAEKRRRRNGGASSPTAKPSDKPQAPSNKIAKARKGPASKALKSTEQPMKVFSRKLKTPTSSPLPAAKPLVVPKPVVAPAAEAAKAVPVEKPRRGRKPAEKPAEKPSPAKTTRSKQQKKDVVAPPAAPAAPPPVVGRKRSTRSLEAEAEAEAPPPPQKTQEPQEETGNNKRRRSTTRKSTDQVELEVPPVVDDPSAAAALDQAGPSTRRRKTPGEDAAGRRAATPAATAAPLDASAPPSAYEDAVEEIGPAEMVMEPTAVPKQRGLLDDDSPGAAARNWIASALKHPRGEEARCAPLRPCSQKIVDFVASNIDSTIQTSQNNSVLLIGGPGTGKTLCMERAVSEVCLKYNTDPQDALVGVVRLTGWLHADERVAFKEVARQLCGAFNLTFSGSASMNDNIQFLRSMLSFLARAHKVAVFILDGFDAFARRPKQTLLYCLLDALQTSGMQAVVLGTTCRHDCIDLLEKRVKSRFSHRTAVICPPRRAAPCPAGEGDEGSDGAIEILRGMLTLPETFPDTRHAARHNAAVKEALTGLQVLSTVDDYISWRPTLHNLANVAMTALMDTLHSPDGLLRKDSILRACRKITDASSNGIERTVAGLSVLELAVLISAHRAAGRVDSGAINFEMTHHEFRLYSTSGDHVDNYTKGAAGKAFERLATQGLVAAVNGRDNALTGPGRHYALVHVQAPRDELKKGIAAHGTCPARLKDWFAREGGAATYAIGVGVI